MYLIDGLWIIVFLPPRDPLVLAKVDDIAKHEHDSRRDFLVDYYFVDYIEILLDTRLKLTTLARKILDNIFLGSLHSRAKYICLH